MANELKAEAFSRAWVMRERFEDRHGGSAAPWLFGIARNVLLMSIRRGAVERRTAVRLVPPARPPESACTARSPPLRKRLTNKEEDQR
jgi:DNA-directed RNA polymerase specialized sigma24 family protein